MPRLEWARSAQLDLVRLREFLLPKSPLVARRAVQAIRRGVRILQTHPELGRTIEGLPPNIREWIIEFGKSAYVARYRIDAEKVVIAAVRHGRELSE